MANLPSAGGKVLTREQVAARVRELQKGGKRVCYTSGVFDILHRGHLEYLLAARQQADALIVGVNSDSSVKQNKGDFRPICKDADRAFVVAGLSCVDAVFVFSEVNNNENIRLLKPDVYAKAGDYSKEKLSSAAIVEEYGGKVALVPFSQGYSSTGIIDRILDGYLGVISRYEELPLPERRPAVFLDRDGTMNEHVEYLGDPKKVKLLPGVVEAVKGFNALGYRVVMITNQPGIGMGYFSVEDFYRVNREVLAPIGKAGGRIDRVYFCPHSAAENCACRKPNTLMIERAAAELNLDLKKSIVVGDTTLDVEMAHRKGMASILVETGVGGKDGSFKSKPTHKAADLPAALQIVQKL